MNIILCGLPMSGKTTIGKMLAQKLAWQFVDTDRLIEAAYERETGRIMTCRQIFISEGEARFRLMEADQIPLILQKMKSVVATGGGMMAYRANAKALAKAGRIVYLEAPVDLIWSRMQTRECPGYLDQRSPEDSFRVLASSRIGTYKMFADERIETEALTEAQIVEEIMERMKKNGQ